MARKALSVAEARATLSDAIREVEAGGTVMITRHGKPVAALVRAEDLERLELLRAAGPEQGLASVAGGWKGSDELVQSISPAGQMARSETKSPTIVHRGDRCRSSCTMESTAVITTCG